MLMAFTAIGAAMLEIMTHATEPPEDAIRWLICGATAAALLSVAAIEETEEPLANHTPHGWRDRLVRLGGVLAALVMGVTGGALAPVVLVGLLAVVLAAQVADAFYQSATAGRRDLAR